MGTEKGEKNWEQSNAPGLVKSPERRQVNIFGDFVEKREESLHQ